MKRELNKEHFRDMRQGKCPPIQYVEPSNHYKSMENNREYQDEFYKLLLSLNEQLQSINIDCVAMLQTLIETTANYRKLSKLLLKGETEL